jgi:hypothetical protein
MRLCGAHGFIECRKINISICLRRYIDNMPTISTITSTDIFSKCYVCIAFDRDSIVIINNN